MRFAFFVAFSFGSNFNFQQPAWIEATREISTGQAAEYDRELTERIELYENPAIENVEVDPLPAYPYLLYFSDVSTDENNWKNIAIAKYYDKNSVRLMEEE